jgi:hypothetical protein
MNELRAHHMHQGIFHRQAEGNLAAAVGVCVGGFVVMNLNKIIQCKQCLFFR